MILGDPTIIAQDFFPDFADPDKMDLTLHGVILSCEFFERYGVGHAATVYCRRGTVPIDQMNADDEFISRAEGFIRPIAVLRSNRNGPTGFGPRVVQVEEDFFEIGAPDDAVQVGRHVHVHAPIMRKDERRPNITPFDLSKFGSVFAECGSRATHLYVPVFLKMTSIKVQGLCVTCPGLAELAEGLSLATAKSLREKIQEYADA